MATQTKNGKSRGCSSWLVKPKNWWSLRYSNIINKNVNKVQMAFLSNILGNFFETKTWTSHVLEIAYFNIWTNQKSCIDKKRSLQLKIINDQKSYIRMSRGKSKKDSTGNPKDISQVTFSEFNEITMMLQNHRQWKQARFCQA